MIRKVLLVDDDPILRIALEKRLAAFADHFTVITAVDGFDAVKQLKKISFSLIVLDLVMPRMDGMSLLAHLREKYPDLPAVVISSMRAVEMQALVRTSGVLAYLSKPFQAADLVSVIMGSLRKEAAGGIMYDVSPTVFLQLMEMEEKTCTIRIFDKVSEAGGVLYFIDGQLVDARVGDLRGLDAAYKVFTWEAVTLFLQNECPQKDNVINRFLQPIIMTAVSMKDESDKPLGDVEDNEVEESDAFGPGEDKARPGSSLHDIRTLLQRETGGKCTIEHLHFDETLDTVVDRLHELGAACGFGSFQACSVTNGKKREIILPGHPAPIFTIKPDSAHDRFLEILEKGSQPPPLHYRQ